MLICPRHPAVQRPAHNQKTPRPARRTPVLAVLACLACLNSTAFANPCQSFADVSSFLHLLDTALHASHPLEPGFVARLRHFTARTEDQLPQLARNIAPETSSAVRALTGDARTLIAARPLQQPALAATRLARARAAISKICNTSKDSLASTDKRAAPADFEDKNGQGVGDDSSMLRSAVLSTLILVILGALCLAIAFAGYLQALLRGLFHGRSSCWIPAYLYAGGERIAGTITVLGRTGCRFKARNVLGKRIVAEAAGKKDIMITCEGYMIPSYIARIEPEHFGTLFECPIGLKLHTQLLLKSSTEIKRLPVGGLPPNVKQQRPNRKRPASVIAAALEPDEAPSPAP